MTIEAVTLNGKLVTDFELNVPHSGPWYAYATVDTEEAITGAVTIVVGAATLRGTVYDGGAHDLQNKLLVIGGPGSFARALTPKDYANDLGVKSRNIAEDVAREMGGIIGSWAPTSATVGRHFARRIQSAESVLAYAAGSAPWWVAFDGTINCGARTGSASTALVLSYDPESNLATLDLDELEQAAIGSTLPFAGGAVVRSATIKITAEALTCQVWCGPAGSSQLGRALNAIATRAASRVLYGKYRYRVIRSAGGNRYELQAISKRPGLPDLVPIDLWPGSPSTHADLALGAEVLVEFIEGDPAQPVVSNFAGRNAPGHVATMLELGGPNGAPAARQGDAVEILLPPMIFSGTIGGTPASGVLTSPVLKTQGTIIGGSTKVEIAT